MKTNSIVRIAVIAALYASVTILLAPISFGATGGFQVRVSEALTVLPFLFPESVLGLFLGCLIANVYGGLGIIDIVFGSLATLIAGYLTGRMPSPYLAPLPPVLVNAVAVGFVLKYTLGLPLFIGMVYVGVGQFIACYFLGLPVLLWLRRYDWNKY